MIFTEIEKSGAYIIEIEKEEDERGFFARTRDKKEFEQNNLNPNWIQSSISFNRKKGTVRGMHYQITPFEETKTVRCTQGRILDIIIDLRRQSQTFKKWFSVELNQENHKMIYIPSGFAQGFQTLEENSEIYYEIDVNYNVEYSKGVRWDDKTFNIKWPLEISVISQRDRSFPDFI
jgi:dTDP-4-dehydrorhamnose 3,5-epimerase